MELDRKLSKEEMQMTRKQVESIPQPQERGKRQPKLKTLSHLSKNGYHQKHK